jgi:hypothetical protein
MQHLYQFQGRKRVLRYMLLIGLSALMLSIPHIVGAAEHNPECGNVTSLKNVINTANTNGEDDQIQLGGAECVYTLDAPLIIEANGAVTIQGSGAVINGNSAVRVLEVKPGATLNLQNIVVEGGTAFEGGGIFNNGTLALTSTTVRGNKATLTWGGGIYNKDGEVTITSSTISGNESLVGGGLYNKDGTVTINDSTLEENTAIQGGGGGLVNDGTMTLNNTRILRNEASLIGGGISNVKQLTINGGEITENAAAEKGGGISVTGTSTTTMTGTTLTKNTAAIEAGGIYQINGTVSIFSSTLSENVATQSDGGAVFKLLGTMTITNSTVTNNRADEAGAIQNDAGLLTLLNSTIANNTGVTGSGGLVNRGPLQIGNTILALNNGDCSNASTISATGVNLVGDGSCNIPNDINGNPLLLPLTGSPAYYPLQPNSPAIDAGTSNICPNTDQRGAARPVDGNGDGTAACDIGAYEAPNSDPSTPDGSTPTPTETPGGPTATPTATITPGGPTFTPTPSLTPTEPTSGTEVVGNGGFEQALSAWTVKSGTSDKVKCNKPDKIISHTGDCAFQFKGGAGENAKLVQNASVGNFTFITGQTLDLSVFVNAKSPAVSGKVKLVLSYTDSTLAPEKVSLNLTSTSNYEPLTGQVTLKSGSVAKLKLQIGHKSASGKVFIDSVSLLQSEAERGLIPLP